MSDQEARLNAFRLWEKGQPHDAEALAAFFRERQRTMIAKAVGYEAQVVRVEEVGPDGEKTFREETVHVAVDDEGNAVLDEAGDPEVLVELPWESLSRALVSHMTQDGEKLAVIVPLFIKLFATWECGEDEIRADAERFLQAVLDGEQKATSCFAVMSLASTEILNVGEESSEWVITEDRPVPPRVQSLIDAAKGMLADWRAENPFDRPRPVQRRAARAYPVQTSQEWDALERAAADGHRGVRYTNDVQSGARIHAIHGLAHYVRLSLTPAEVEGGFGLEALETLTSDQDADGIFALLYVSRLLSPLAPIEGGYAGGWVDLNDVMDKIGWTPRSSAEREEKRGRIYRYLLFGARAQVIGARPTVYIDRKTGQQISTRIESPLWAFLSEQRPMQPHLFPSMDVPLRVELVISKQWEALMTLPDTAQYLPLGEMLGAIPGNKPGGAWARTAGLALMNFWRRQPRAALDGSLQPTRRDLLTRYTPKTVTPQEILKGNDPRRALEYWHTALQELAAREVVDRAGEASHTLTEMKQALPRYLWQEQWLDEAVDLRPGPAARPAVEAVAKNKPIPIPHDLRGQHRRGRPRKQPA